MSDRQSVEVDLDKLRARMQHQPVTEEQIDLLFALIETSRDQAAKAETARKAWTEIGARSEADAAALRAAAEIVRSEYSVLLERPLPDVYAVMQHLRWPVGHLALTAELHNAGAALLSELEAARAALTTADTLLEAIEREYQTRREQSRSTAEQRWAAEMELFRVMRDYMTARKARS